MGDDDIKTPPANDDADTQSTDDDTEETEEE